MSKGKYLNSLSMDNRRDPVHSNLSEEIEMFRKVKVEQSSTLPKTKEAIGKFTFITGLLTHVRILFILGGIYPGVRRSSISKRKGFYAKFQMTLVVIIITLYLVQASLFSYAVYNRVIKEEYLTRLVTFFAILGANTLLSVFASCTLPTHLTNLEEALQRYENHHGLHINANVWLGRIQISTIAFVVFTLFSHPLFVYLISTAPEIAHDMFPFCRAHECLKYPVLIFNTAVFVVTGMQWYGYFIVCVFFSSFLLQEFKAINYEFKELVKCPSPQAEQIFEQLIDHHECAVDVLNHMNYCVSFYNFLGLFLSIPINCILIYSTITKPISASEFQFMLIGGGSGVLVVANQLFLEACVSTKAHGPLQYVWKLRKSIDSDKGIRSLNLFISRLTSDSLGYNIYGLLTINMPTLLAIFGTFATYIIVVVQFGPAGTTSPCELPTKNISYCIIP